MVDPTINESKVKELIKLCENRLDVSYYKYGSAKANFGEGRVDAVGTAERCIEKYKKTHNLEYLLDAINYLMFQNLFPYPNDIFVATGSSDSAGTVGTPINYER